MSTVTISRKAAADADRADDIVSHLYERWGAIRLQRNTCQQILALKEREARELRASNHNRGGTSHAGWIMDGTLYDPEGEVAGSWKVTTYPNGAGFISVKMRLTREERQRRIERVQAEHYSYAMGVEECRAGQGDAWVDEALANLERWTRERITTLEHGFEPQ